MLLKTIRMHKSILVVCFIKVRTFVVYKTDSLEVLKVA